MLKLNPKKTIAVFLIFLLMLLWLEVSLRRAMPDFAINKIIKESLVPGLGYELRPNAELKFEGAYYKIPPSTIKISSQGMRDREYDHQKPAGTKRIAILGDSVAFGWGVEGHQSFAKVIENDLNSCQKNVKFEVINFSVPGYNLEQYLITLKDKAIRYNIDYALIYVIGNDFDGSVWHKKDPFWSVFEKSFIARKIYFGMSSFLKAMGGLFPFRYLYYSRGVKKILPKIDALLPVLESKNVKLILVFQNYFDDLDKIKRFCKVKNVPFLLVDDHISWSEKLMIKGDGHHNPEGNRTIAGIIFSFLKNNNVI